MSSRHVPRATAAASASVSPPTPTPASASATTGAASAATDATATAPQLTLVSLAAVTWNFPLVGRTRMLAEAWDRQGQPAVFVQVPSYRTALERVLAPLRPPDECPVVRPWPTLPARWWERAGPRRVRAWTQWAARRLRRQLERRLLLDRAVALVVTPVWTPWLEELPFKHVVYDCIDELRVHVPSPRLADQYRQWEDELIARAGGAVVTAEALGADLKTRRPDLPIALIRNGVDVDRFQEQAASTPRPADVPQTERPIIGFVGALYDWIDWELIAGTARRLPECDFVLVGPHDGRGDVTRVAALPNVHLLGPRPYAQVPAYLDTFTACWVPFLQNSVGRAANPVKIYEYLALGKPVVTTPVADTESFGDLVTVVASADEAEHALRAALVRPADGVAARVAFARRNTWAARASEITAWITQHVAAGAGAR